MVEEENAELTSPRKLIKNIVRMEQRSLTITQSLAKRLFYNQGYKERSSWSWLPLLLSW